MADWRDQWERSNLLDSKTWSVDWRRAGLAAIGAVLTAFFDAVADVVGSLWATFVIRPATAIADGVETVVETPLTRLEEAISFGALDSFVADTGLIGTVAVALIASYGLVYLYGEVSQDG